MSITIPSRLKRPRPYDVGDTTAGQGMNNLLQPERLDAGQAVDVLNLLWHGGSWSTRPGISGQLTSAHGAAVYLSRTRYMMSTGVARIPYSTGGKLYYFAVGASAGVEITKPGPVSFSFTDSKNVRYSTVGKYLYFIDSGDTSGSVWRVNLESTTVAEEVRGLTAPTITPFTSLRDGSVLAGSVGALTWGNTAAAGTDTEIIQSGRENFENTGSFWTFVGASNVNTLDANGIRCVELDANSGDKDYARFASVQSLPSFGSSVPGLESLKRRLAKIEFTYAATENTGGTDPEQSVRVVLSGTDSNGYMFNDAQMDETTPTVRVFPASRFRGIADFRTASGVTHLQIRLESPTAVTTKGCDVNQITIKVPDSTLSVTNSSGTAIVKQGTALAFNSTLYTDGLSAWAALSSTQDWSGVETVSADIRKDGAVSSLTLQFGAKTSAGWYWTPSVSIVGQEQAAFDVSAIAPYLSATTHFAFRVVGDLTVANLAEGGTQALFTVANLRTPGNLTAGVAVSYIWTQVKATGTSYPADVVYEGSGSPFSNPIVPTVTQRRATVRIKNSAGTAPTLDSATTHIAFYRLGTATPGGDTRAKLIALVPVGADATSPTATTQDEVSNKYYWDVSEWTFYDNAPDEDLIATEPYQLSRDMVPLGATAIAHHAGRLWLARYDSTRRVNDVYGSWLIDGLNDWPYMSEATDPTDPELDTKGILLRLGGQGSGDRAVAFSSANLDTQNNRGASLMVLRQSAPPAIISGWTPSDFALNPAPVGIGGGLLSPEGVENVNGATVYLASTGLVSSQGYNLDYASEAIERRLSLEVIGKSRYSQTFLCWHNRRLWCIVPGASSTDGEALVWDERVKGWSRVVGYNSLGFTSACSLSGGEDSGDLYIGGRDGQIYKLSGSVASPTATTDKATPSGTARAISWSLQTRSHGQKDAETEIRYAYNRVNRLLFDITSGVAGTLTWTITNERGEVSTGTFALPSGRTQKTDIREFGDIRGMAHYLTLSSDATAGSTLHSYAMGIVDMGETR